ncbi:MAG: SAM hydrolase/SAM-dependent halogenase family protein [Actinomycetes bacterium]
MTGYAVIGFLTDYGTEDGFVGTCHAVMAGLAPNARVIDVTHQVPPGDVRRGASVLADSAPWFPPSVLLAVVDPGVGTARRAIAVDAGPCVLVGPDNGLLSRTWEALGGVGRAVALAPHAGGRHGPSATFHGRDVFAPAAARLATGTDLHALGPRIDPASLVTLPPAVVRVLPGRVETEVLTVDRFGNLQLAAGPDDLRAAFGDEPPRALLLASGDVTRPVRRGRAFADVAPGEPVLLTDSAGRLAVAVNQGSAATALGLAPGDAVRLSQR